MDGGRSQFREEIDTRIALRDIANRYARRDRGVLATILRRMAAEIEAQIKPSDSVSGVDCDVSGPFSMVSRDVKIGGDCQRLTMERDFWTALDLLADDGMITVSDLCQRALDRGCGKPSSLASAIRILVLHHYASEIRLRNVSSITIKRLSGVSIA